MAAKPIVIIAGLDPTGGAGISMDIRAAASLNSPCAVAATGFALQAHDKGYRVEITPPEVFRKNLECCFSVDAGAVKIGMLSSGEIAETVTHLLVLHNDLPVVVDPVIESSSGMKLIDHNGLGILTKKILPIASLITPNWPECKILTGEEVDSLKKAIIAGEKLFEKTGAPVLVKGGHSCERPVDVLVEDSGITEFVGEKIAGDFRGTGCALSSLIAAGLANGDDLIFAIRKAKSSIERAMRLSNPPYLTFGNNDD